MQQNNSDSDESRSEKQCLRDDQYLTSVSDPDSLNPDPAKNLNPDPDPGKFVTPTKNFMNFFLHQIPVIR